MRVIPLPLRMANDFVEQFHRHSRRTARDGGKFAIGLDCGGEVSGVAIVGNPLSATFMDGFTAEVLRTCVAGNVRNANSMLYGACAKAWFAMGGTRLITYTLLHESGASLKGAGWKCEALINGHDARSWGKTDSCRRTEQAVIALKKRRWEIRSSLYCDGAIRPSVPEYASLQPGLFA